MTKEKQIRPRLKGDVESWAEIVKLGNEITPSKLLSRLYSSNEKQEERQISVDSKKGECEEVFTVQNPPTNLEMALKNSKVDLTKWKVQKWLWNHWAGFYQVKVWYEKVDEEKNKEVELMLSELKKGFRSRSSKTKIKKNGKGVGVVLLSDFHYGFKYDGDLKNPHFSVSTLTKKIKHIANIVNNLGYKEVHLALLGDFIESFTGLNHLDTWKNLSHYGGSAAKGVSSMLSKYLISRISNLEKIYIVAGNHDRVTPKKDIDSSGDAARIIADFLELMQPNPIVFDNYILNPKIDGIKYIMSHGHLGLSKKTEQGIILEFGDQNTYNVIVQGHNHSREVKKNYTYRKDKTSSVVSLEGSNFRKITVPPLVTGGTYSLSLGVFSTCGLTIIENNGNGGINHHDISL